MSRRGRRKRAAPVVKVKAKGSHSHLTRLQNPEDEPSKKRGKQEQDVASEEGDVDVGVKTRSGARGNKLAKSVKPDLPIKMGSASAGRKVCHTPEEDFFEESISVGDSGDRGNLSGPSSAMLNSQGSRTRSRRNVLHLDSDDEETEMLGSNGSDKEDNLPGPSSAMLNSQGQGAWTRSRRNVLHLDSDDEETEMLGSNGSDKEDNLPGPSSAMLNSQGQGAWTRSRRNVLHLDSDDEETEMLGSNGTYSVEHEAVIARRVESALKMFKENHDEIVMSYYRKFGPASQAINSFNFFMKKQLPEILVRNGYFEHVDVVDAVKGIRRIHRVSITGASIEGFNKDNGLASAIIKQTGRGERYILYPHEARTRGLTYSRSIIVTMKNEVFEMDSAENTKLISVGTDQQNIGEIPIMVKSDFCSLNKLSQDELMEQHEDPDDPGGYFIVRGKEKVIITQERLAYNQYFILKPACNESHTLEIEIRSMAHHTSEDVSALWIRIPGRSQEGVMDSATANLKFHMPSQTVAPTPIVPHPDTLDKHRSPLEKKYTQSKPGLVVYHVTLRDTFPLLILFKALGLTDDKSIWRTLAVRNTDAEKIFDAFKPTFEDVEANSVKTRHEALVHIGKLVKVRANEQFDSMEDREAGKTRQFNVDEHEARGLTFILEDLLPHLGSCDDNLDSLKKKANHIGYMVCILLQSYLGLIPYDDRDHLQNKRYDTPGFLMSSLLKKLLSSTMEEMRKRLARKVDRKMHYDFFSQIAGCSTLTNGFVHALTTGKWGDSRLLTALRDGVSQPLNRVTGVATLSFLRRINSPVNRLARMLAPRKVHNTAFGYICPADTPEGSPVGFLKNQAMMAQVSVEADPIPVLKALRVLKMNPFTEENLPKLATETKIILDATIVGTCSDNPDVFVKRLRGFRTICLDPVNQTDTEKEFTGAETPLTPAIDHQISITHDIERREIRIRTDAGRKIRPLLKVQNNCLRLKEDQISRLLNKEDSFSWEDLIINHVIEFVDPAESENALVALFPSNLMPEAVVSGSGWKYSNHRPTTFTHCEVDPSGILGTTAGLVPFPNHAPVPRLSFQTNMSKQAIGLYALNYAYRFDAESNVLFHLQKPLVTCTGAAEFTSFDKYPAGLNAIVAVCCYMGYNQEDSLILNTSSIQRGLFRSMSYKIKEDVAKASISGDKDGDEQFERPSESETGRAWKEYIKKLEEDGLPEVGCEINDSDILVGKTQVVSKAVLEQNRALRARTYVKKDISEQFRIPCYSGSDAGNAGPKDPIPPNRTLVDLVSVYDNAEGYRACKIRLRNMRTPQMGDKFASRHGQKGVVGLTVDECDMPFTSYGMVPDIIINPHAIPKRMTVGHLLESLDSKRAALTGKISSRPLTSTNKDWSGITGVELVEEIGKTLAAAGFEPTGFETMYCGMTGRKILANIFIAPTFYQRLKHMTQDKLRYRARGNLALTTRQPTGGLQREGGLRFGEMERDAAIAHGGMHFLRERLFLQSDYYMAPVCHNCGQIVTTTFIQDPNPRVRKSKPLYRRCSFCSSSNDAIIRVEMPYAAKLMFQELMSMNIRVAVIPDFRDKSSQIIRHAPPVTVPFAIGETKSIVDSILEESDDYQEREEAMQMLLNYPDFTANDICELLNATP